MVFKVGQKIVCKIPIKHSELGELVKDKIYTCMGYSSIRKSEILLKEFPTPHCSVDKYAIAGEWRFEPLELDYDFVDEVTKEVTPKHNELAKL